MYSSGVHPEPGFYKNDRKNSEKKEPENRFKLKQVANRMGGYATAASVRMIANRFLRENQKPVP